MMSKGVREAIQVPLILAFCVNDFHLISKLHTSYNYSAKMSRTYDLDPYLFTGTRHA